MNYSNKPTLEYVKYEFRAMVEEWVEEHPNCPLPKDLQSFSIRNAKFYGIETTKEFDDICDTSMNKANWFLRDLIQRYTNGELIQEQLPDCKGGIHLKKPIKVDFDWKNKKNSKAYKDIGEYAFRAGDEVSSFSISQWRALHENQFDDVCERGDNLSEKRNLILLAVERFASYINRNKNKKDGSCKPPNSTMKLGQSFYLKDRFVTPDFEKQTLTFRTIGGEFVLKYNAGHMLSELQDCMNNDVSENKKTGKTKIKVQKSLSGNYIHKQKCFVTIRNVPFVPMYKPQGFLGIDINKKEDYWITLHDGTIIKKDDKLIEMYKELSDLNTKCKDKTLPLDPKGKLKKAGKPYRKYRRKDRTKFLTRRKKLHAELEKEINKVSHRILSMAVNNSWVVCIDAVACGSITGDFGQMHIIRTLVTACENYGIPYFVINPAYTSQDCSKCGNTDKESLTRETDKYECTHCGYSEVAHINAAKNIALRGQQLYESCVPYRNDVAKSRWKIKTKCEKYPQWWAKFMRANDEDK